MCYPYFDILNHVKTKVYNTEFSTEKTWYIAISQPYEKYTRKSTEWRKIAPQILRRFITWNKFGYPVGSKLGAVQSELIV